MAKKQTAKPPEVTGGLAHQVVKEDHAVDYCCPQSLAAVGPDSAQPPSGCQGSECMAWLHMGYSKGQSGTVHPWGTCGMVHATSQLILAAMLPSSMASCLRAVEESQALKAVDAADTLEDVGDPPDRSQVL